MSQQPLKFGVHERASKHLVSMSSCQFISNVTNVSNFIQNVVSNIDACFKHSFIKLFFDTVQTLVKTVPCIKVKATVMAGTDKNSDC